MPLVILPRLRGRWLAEHEARWRDGRGSWNCISPFRLVLASLAFGTSPASGGG
jgi:hypothetical protein